METLSPPPGGTPPAPLPSASPAVSADEQRAHFLARRKAMLAAWVARLNTLRNNGAYKAIEHRISCMLGAVEREETSRGQSPTSLEKRIDTWLARSPGKVGGPEQEQDPTRPHATGWHGEPSDEPNEQQQR
jgi:hypothetical protein